MQDRELNCATFRVANPGDMSGAVTADKMIVGLRNAKGRILRRIARYGLLGAAVAVLPLQQAMAGTDGNRAILPTGFLDVSTIPPEPASQDQNPYGVAFVPNGFPSGGKLSPGDTLVSNFNNPSNTQGTGTTITKVAPDGETSTFFTGIFLSPTDGGLTTALGVLKRGFVVVGQLPNNNGTPEPGSLLFLDRNGTPVLKFTNVNGPWDLTIDDDFDHARVFVSNVLSGKVVRLDVSVGSSKVTVTNVTEVAHGYAFGLNMAAFVVGPTGLAYDAEADVLYVASTSDNEIFKILHAETTNTSVLKGILVYNLWNRQGLASEGP